MTDNNFSPTVTGTGNIANLFGRDISITQQFDQAPDFVTPDLDPKKFDADTPRIARDSIKIVEQERLLIMGGGPDVEKPHLARQVAASLLKKPSNQSLVVKEWLGGSESRSLISTVNDTQEATLFLLPNLQPQDVNCDLHRLQVVTQHKHYIIGTTEVDLSTWQLDSATERRFWQPLRTDEVYDDDLLSKILFKSLRLHRNGLPAPFNRILPKDEVLIAGRSIQDIALQLETPTNIDLFVNLLLHEVAEVNESRLVEVMSVASDSSRVVNQSFRNLSDVNLQLSALGVTFFEGMLDDQAFAAIEQLYFKAWKTRNPDLVIPDYCDLDRLQGGFFTFIETAGGANLLENRVQNQRRVMIETAWNSHRRHLLATLPILTTLVVDSVAQDASGQNRELFGDIDLRRRLRDSVSETLSDFGLISSSAVENHLASLASNPNEGVQAVAAKAMARWRYFGHDDQLFELLDRWQNAAYAKKFMRMFFTAQQQSNAAMPEDFLRATIALTVGYAAQYDHANQLRNELITRIEEFALDPSPLVRKRFHRTLLLVVPLHAEQLKDRLRKMTQNTDLLLPIAGSLAVTYRANPASAMMILDDWYAQATEEPTAAAIDWDEGERESLLAVVVLAYGFLDLEASDIDPVTERLKTVLANEHDPIVREAIIYAIGNMASRDFSRLSEMLRQVVAKVSPEEMRQVVDRLLGVFKKPRAALEEGEATMELHGVSYPIWVDRDRPLTEIEQTLMKWLTDKGSTALPQQIALASWVRFEGYFHEAEQERIEEIRDERNKESDNDNDEEGDDSEAKPAEVSQVAKSPLAIVLLGLFYPAYRGAGQALSTQALSYKGKPEILDTVVERWSNEGPEAKRVAANVRRALLVQTYLRKLRLSS